MNRKQLIALLVFVLVIGGAGLAVYKHSAASWGGGGKPSGKVLGDFVLNDVARVVIQTCDTTLTLAKKDDRWVVVERGDYPADFARIGDFIQGLWQLKPAQEVKVGPSQFARLDLISPGKGVANAATLVELQNKDCKRMVALRIGKRFLKRSSQFPGEEGVPAGRYVMPENTETPSSVSLVTETFEQADPGAAAWLDKTFLRIDRIQSVAVASGTTQWRLSRNSDSASEWKLADLMPEEKVDTSKVPSFAEIFGAPSFTDVLAIDAKRDEFDTIATVETFDGFIYTLKFGKADGNNLPMSVAVTANLPKARTPDQHEKPEDKKRLDDEFASRSKLLAATLEKAKQLESHVYVVSKGAFDALWKPRAEMLAEKPAPTSTQASGSAPSDPVLKN